MRLDYKQTHKASQIELKKASEQMKLSVSFRISWQFTFFLFLILLIRIIF